MYEDEPIPDKVLCTLEDLRNEYAQAKGNSWYLRSEIVWHKPNPMPESVTDRPTKSHEMIYLLAKNGRYFYDAEAIKEPSKDPIDDRGSRVAEEHKRFPTDKINGIRASGVYPTRNKRDVWTVTTRSYKEAHFATFPEALIEPCILAGTSEKGECPKCGKAWVRVVEKETHFEGGSGKAGTQPEDIHGKWEGKQYGKNLLLGPVTSSQTTGWQPQCECGLEPVSQTVLDPFNGAGTSGVVSIKHGRNYIGFELNPAYIKLTHKRLAEVQPVLI